VDDTAPPSGIRATLAAASKRHLELPPRARPVVTRPLRLVPTRPTITPGVNIVRTRTPEEERERLRRNELLWTAVSGTDVDWTRLDVEATAHQLFLACERGLPRAIPIGYREDVLALEGVNLEQLETTARIPERVEIRPETGKKGYPILGFYRGDVAVILGMRRPTRPAVIAAYWTALLAHDTYRAPERTGGGGARKSSGLPATVPALVKRLCQEGATVDEAWKTGCPATVHYRGQDLGKITTGPGATKQQVQLDWQRTQRKMQAIDRREANAS
jgi:hypothetical protein